MVVLDKIKIMGILAELAYLKLEDSWFDEEPSRSYYSSEAISDFPSFVAPAWECI